MAVSKSVLGKTLGGLLTESLVDDSLPEERLTSLMLTQVQRGAYQPRAEIDQQKLSELADSIRAQGVVQPIVVRPVSEDKYEIIAGERRFRAAKLAGLERVPAVVREMNNETALVCALVENVQRQDLNAIDEANALERLSQEFSLTHQEISTLVGKSRTAVTNALRLLQLDKFVQEQISLGNIEAGHAKILVSLDKPLQVELAKEIIAKQLSVRQAEQRVRELAQSKADKKVNKVPEVLALEKTFAEKFGQKVSINHRASGKGKVVIQYGSLEELEALLAKA